MATLTSSLTRIFSTISPFKKTDTSSQIKQPSSQAHPLRSTGVQYASAAPMLATAPSEVKPKALLATTQPATQNATMQVPTEDPEGKKSLLGMRGGLNHEHEGTELCHDVCGCLICCDFMDVCCTAIDDVICCE